MIFTFKPKYSPEVTLKNGDDFDFQWSGRDEDSEEFEMYNNCAEMVEKDGILFVLWNGTYYDPETFFDCGHLDGDFSMDAVKIVGNYLNIK